VFEAHFGSGPPSRAVSTSAAVSRLRVFGFARSSRSPRFNGACASKLLNTTPTPMRTADVLATFAKANADLDTTRSARQLAAQPRISESVRTHKAVSEALDKFRPDQLHPLHEEALLVAMDANIAEALEHLGAVRSKVVDDPAMRQVLRHANKAMHMVREADRDRPRSCEDRLHLRRPGRAPRRATNARRRRGSRRVTRAGPSSDPDLADEHDLGRPVGAGGR
jgi:hypothetical protein